MATPFQILGLGHTNCDRTIKTKYRELSMQWHPDRNPGCTVCEQRFKRINNAYEFLKDPLNRRRFLEKYNFWKKPIHGKTYKQTIRVKRVDASEGKEIEVHLPNLRDRGAPERVFRVNLPQGITEGKTIRLRGLGYPGKDGGGDGCALLKVKYLKERKSKWIRIAVPATISLVVIVYLSYTSSDSFASILQSAVH